MKRTRGGIVTIALFALAATLLTFSVVGSSQAALTYYSQTYGAEVSMQDIGVSLLENGNVISSRDYSGADDVWTGSNGRLAQDLLEDENGEREQLRLGHKYREELAVQNSGNIDEYVRVTLYRYWQDASGQKAPELDSSLIDLHLNLGNGWREDTSSRTEERTVLYYDPILAVGAATPAFTDTLEIQDEGVEAQITKDVTTDADGNTVITTSYDYDGMRFVIRADVDAVQTHNAEQAKMSAWGTVG